MQIKQTRIKGVYINFKRQSEVNWTIIKIQTEADENPVEFSIAAGNWSYDEWKINMIFHYARVTDAEQLVGKSIKVVLDENNQTIGYGIDYNEYEDFFLLNEQERKRFKEAELQEVIQNLKVKKPSIEEATKENAVEAKRSEEDELWHCPRCYAYVYEYERQCCECGIKIRFPD